MFEFYLSEDIPYKSEIISIPSGLSYPLKRKVASIIFVSQHPVSVFFGSSHEIKKIRVKQYFLLPSDISCHLEVEEDSELFCLQIPNMALLYMYYITSRLKEIRYDAKNLFYPLDTIRFIDLVVDNMKTYTKEDRTSHALIGIKCHEFFYLLKHYYTEDKLQSFFSPILTNKYDFALFDCN